MALECECFFLEDPRVMGVAERRVPLQQACQSPQKARTEIDICEILKRTEDEYRKHNDYECHLKGEKRQNLINKMKMFLDDCDDRPVMKLQKAGDLTAKGQTGYGCLIKYPGYVDYDHPYFSDPYDKMPELGMTTNRRGGQNPCPPISVRNWDETHRVGKKSSKSGGQTGRGGSSRSGGGCHCAKRTAKPARCMASPECQGQGQWQGGRGQGQQGDQTQRGRVIGQVSSPAMVCVCRPKAPQPALPPSGGMKYYCYPLPNN